MITSRLFEAFLACPVKCHLLSKGEVPAGTEYSAWAAAREESYRRESFRKLTSQETGPDIAAAEPGIWKHESWRFAFGKTVRTESWEAEIALIERITHAGAQSRFVPIRFAAKNRLTASDKTMAAFEAISLAKALGTKTGAAKIVHGEKQSTFSVNAAALSRALHRKVSLVASLLSAVSPPDTVLNRHCPECGVHDRCRKTAVDKDELSLLSTLTDKERTRYRGKGIFTVSQLAYTFRPRRRSKRLAARPERYHHALKALAIRERKIHVVGNPELPLNGTPVFLDVEGLPDVDFYYLIGLRVEGAGGSEHRSLWADSPADEKRIWDEFLGILSDVDRPMLLHYGSFEKTFLKKMCERHGGPPEHSAVETAIASATNLLAVIYARIYFPSYSNGLKEIARFLGFEWSDPSASGLRCFRKSTSNGTLLPGNSISHPSGLRSRTTLAVSGLPTLTGTSVSDPLVTAMNSFSLSRHRWKALSPNPWFAQYSLCFKPLRHQFSTCSRQNSGPCLVAIARTFAKGANIA